MCANIHCPQRTFILGKKNVMCENYARQCCSSACYIVHILLTSRDECMGTVLSVPV